MKNFYHMLWVGLILLLHSGYITATSDDEDTESDDGEVSRVKRGAWSMFRLGRGLQMLRLGKRQSSGNAMSAEELHNYLASVLEGKKLGERQVPMPRYGKDLDWQTAYEKSVSGLNDDGQIERRSDADFQQSSDDYPHLRPFPRGGKIRFRRSLKARLSKLSQDAAKLATLSDNYHFSDEERERAVALPRIGRFSKDRAVPAPRIG